jgi:hypothetical protein
MDRVARVALSIAVVALPVDAGASVPPYHYPEPRRQSPPDDPEPENVGPGTAPIVPRKAWPVGFGTGLFVAPLSNDPVGVATTLSFAHEEPRWAIDLKGMIGAEFASETPIGSFAVLSIGARFYSGSAETSLFIGLGPSFSTIAEPGDTDVLCGSCFPYPPILRSGWFSGTGFGTYAEGGVKFQRHRRFPLAITLRADMPLYRQYREPAYAATPTGSAYRFEVPISLICSMDF